jgi:UDPglucose 6-dehydrogenase
MITARRLFPTLSYGESMVEAVRGADLVLVLTEWPEFVQADAAALACAAASAVMIDGRNCLDRESWTTVGWRFAGVEAPVAVDLPLPAGPQPTRVRNIPATAAS